MITFKSRNKKDIELDKAINKGISKMKSIYRTRKRIKDFYEKNKDKNIYFATFTFNEEHYPPNISSFTKYLRRNNVIYCLYPDYGEKNKRYHLHGYIVLKMDPDLKKKKNYYYTDEVLNNYGYSTLIRLNEDNERLEKYTIKYSIKYDDEIEKKYQRLLTNDKKEKPSIETIEKRKEKLKKLVNIYFENLTDTIKKAKIKTKL